MEDWCQMNVSLTEPKKRKYTCEDDDPEENDQHSDKNIYIINNHLYFSSDITPKSAFTLCKSSDPLSMRSVAKPLAWR